MMLVTFGVLWILFGLGSLDITKRRDKHREVESDREIQRMMRLDAELV